MTVREKIDINSDLSEASYEDVVLKLYQMTGNYPAYATLKVSLWDADVAIQIAAKYKNCDILISRDLKMDEWEVSCMNYKTEERVEIYSPGA